MSDELAVREDYSGFGFDLVLEALHQGIDGHDAQIDIATCSHGHSVGIPLLVADH